MAEWYRQGKLLIRLPELSDNSTNSHLVAKKKELAKETNITLLKSYATLYVTGCLFLFFLNCY
jgi:hypothetical protein